MFGKKRINEFKKGMEAGAKPFVEKNEKLAENFEEVSEKLINNIKEPLNTIIGIEEEHDVRIEDLEYARSFQLKSFESIDSLSDNEKKIFAGLIFTFASQLQNKTGSDSSKLQKEYINAILLKLGVSSPQQDILLESVANIQDSSKQLLLLSLFCEYAFLENNTFDFLNKYEELFENFRFNKKDICNIQSAIEAEIKIRGLEGVVKKYEKPIFIPEHIEDNLCVEKESDLLDEETKKYFDEKFLSPRLAAGKSLFCLGIEKLKIANNLFKPIVDEKNSWIYECTKDFDEGDKIAFLGAGINDIDVVSIKNCEIVLWFLYNDKELTKNPLIKNQDITVDSIIINRFPVPIYGFSGSKIASALLSVNSDDLDNFCVSVSDFCKKELDVLKYIETKVQPFLDKYKNDNYLSEDDMLKLSAIGTWFKKLVLLPVFGPMGSLNQNAESEIKEIKEMVDFLLDPDTF